MFSYIFDFLNLFYNISTSFFIGIWSQFIEKIEYLNKNHILLCYFIILYSSKNINL